MIHEHPTANMVRSRAKALADAIDGFRWYVLHDYSAAFPEHMRMTYAKSERPPRTRRCLTSPETFGVLL